MKKIFLGVALSASVLSFAQIDFGQTRFGVTAGGNYSRVKNAHNPSGPRYAFQGGVAAMIPVDNNDQFYIQPEVVYYGAGESGKDKNAKSSPYYNAVYANNYISVPLYFKGYFSEAESEFFGLLGPRFNFLIGQKVEGANPIYNTDKFGKASSFEFAIGVGAGFSYKRQLELSLRYDAGITNTYPELYKEYDIAADPNTQKKKSQQVVSLNLNYFFD